jgi:hypothetical protein
MFGTIDGLARAQGRRLRVAVLPVAAAATIFSVVGKGLGWRIGAIAILAAVTIWTYVLYFMADRRCEQMRSQNTTAGSSGSDAVTQLHQHVCETTDYWDYLHDLLAEVANTSIPDILAEPAELPTNSAELGPGFIGSEKMMRELLDHLIPPKSRYVAYYIFGDKMLPSSEVHNGWKGRPPDLQRDSLRHELLLTMVQRGDWLVLPDVNNPAPEDREYTPLCFDKNKFQSFGSLPLRVEEPVSNTGPQYGLAVGALIIESPMANDVSEDFCRTAMQVAADTLALAFASARSRFTRGSVNA